MGEPKPDPNLKKYYEENPFDPLVGAKLVGKFLGSLLTFDRPMNPFILVGSILVGLTFLIPGLIGGNIFGMTLGAAILLNVARNLRR
jgi:hypothetical protein